MQHFIDFQIIMVLFVYYWKNHNTFDNFFTFYVQYNIDLSIIQHTDYFIYNNINNNDNHNTDNNNSKHKCGIHAVIR